LLQVTNRPAEAELMMRRALRIDEQNYGENHPDIATSLSNLASLLQYTNRHEEAEYLSKRQLEIFLNFTRTTGKSHPNLIDAANDHVGLLQYIGRNPEQIRSALEGLGQRFGVDLVGVSEQAIK
jgi:hypothetical protein